MLKHLMIIAALAATPLSAHAVQPTPDWSSDRILAERPTASQDAIIAGYTQTIREASGTVTTKTGTITLAADFIDVTTGDDHWLDDFALCRSLAWTTGKSEIDNASCYALPAFRLLELANRKALNRMLRDAASEKPAPAFLSNYWAEQVLAIQYKSADPLTRETESGETQWRLGDEVVVRTGASSFDFTPREKAAVARYFSRHVDLHPQILHAILGSGQWPEHFVIQGRMPDGSSTETLDFSNFHRGLAAYPLPSGLTSRVAIDSQEDTLRGRALRQAIHVMDGSGPAKPALQTVLNGIVAAANDHRDLEGTLLFFEMTQLYTGELASADGLAHIRTINDSITTVYRSPASKSFVDASDIAGKSAEGAAPEAAARYLAQAKDMAKLAFGTFRFVTYANLARSTSDSANWDKSITGSMPSLADCYWLHIAAAPWGANVYTDLGNLSLDNFDVAAAWEAWDIGRAVDPDWQTGVMKSIAEYEGRLREDAADSF